MPASSRLAAARLAFSPSSTSAAASTTSANPVSDQAARAFLVACRTSPIMNTVSRRRSGNVTATRSEHQDQHVAHGDSHGDLADRGAAGGEVGARGLWAGAGAGAAAAAAAAVAGPGPGAGAGRGGRE